MNFELYMQKLICPPDGIFLKVDGNYDWSVHEACSVHGILLTSDNPTDIQQAQRVLKPGGHLLLMVNASTAHIGACRAEDMGFEVRDCLCIADEPDDRLHYVAKAPTKERDAGLEKQGKKRVNEHPTVKPVGVMRRLMNKISADATVLDPFLGSGTTGVAAKLTGHKFLGIEKEEDYFKIALARCAGATK